MPADLRYTTNPAPSSAAPNALPYPVNNANQQWPAARCPVLNCPGHLSGSPQCPRQHSAGLHQQRAAPPPPVVPIPERRPPTSSSAPLQLSQDYQGWTPSTTPALPPALSHPAQAYFWVYQDRYYLTPPVPGMPPTGTFQYDTLAAVHSTPPPPYASVTRMDASQRREPASDPRNIAPPHSFPRQPQRATPSLPLAGGTQYRYPSTEYTRPGPSTVGSGHSPCPSLSPVTSTIASASSRHLATPSPNIALSRPTPLQPTGAAPSLPLAEDPRYKYSLTQSTRQPPPARPGHAGPTSPSPARGMSASPRHQATPSRDTAPSHGLPLRPALAELSQYNDPATQDSRPPPPNDYGHARIPSALPVKGTSASPRHQATPSRTVAPSHPFPVQLKGAPPPSPLAGPPQYKHPLAQSTRPPPPVDPGHTRCSSVAPATATSASPRLQTTAPQDIAPTHRSPARPTLSAPPRARLPQFNYPSTHDTRPGPPISTGRTTGPSVPPVRAVAPMYPTNGFAPPHVNEFAAPRVNGINRPHGNGLVQPRANDVTPAHGNGVAAPRVNGFAPPQVGSPSIRPGFQHASEAPTALAASNLVLLQDFLDHSSGFWPHDNPVFNQFYNQPIPYLSGLPAFAPCPPPPLPTTVRPSDIMQPPPPRNPTPPSTPPTSSSEPSTPTPRHVPETAESAEETDDTETDDSDSSSCDSDFDSGLEVFMNQPSGGKWVHAPQPGALDVQQPSQPFVPSSSPLSSAPPSSPPRRVRARARSPSVSSTVPPVLEDGDDDWDADADEDEDEDAYVPSRSASPGPVGYMQLDTAAGTPSPPPVNRRKRQRHYSDSESDSDEDYVAPPPRHRHRRVGPTAAAPERNSPGFTAAELEMFARVGRDLRSANQA